MKSHKERVQEYKKGLMFTPAELNQLHAYIDDREREGWYYGNKEQFEKRHKSIKSKLLANIFGL